MLLELITSLNSQLLAGCMLLISGFFDVVDGCVARYTQKVSKKGAFIDSTLDKIAELVILTGVTIGVFRIQ